MKRTWISTVALVPAVALVFAVIAFAKDAPTTENGDDAVTQQGFVPIFNGSDLKGWEGDPKLWSVQDGVIVGQTSDEDPIEYNTFLKWTLGEVDDFELKLEYRITSGNSGVQIRSFDLEQPYAVGGYQADIDADLVHTGLNYGEKFRGILARRGQKAVVNEEGKPEVTGSLGDPEELASHINKDGWNSYHIIAKGNHFTYKINDVVMSELTDEDTDTRRRSGLLAFQLHKGPAMKVEFRNIELKRLPLEDLKKVIFVAGPPSHGPGQHEHNAGCLLASRLLNENLSDRVLATPYLNGWPSDPTAFQNVDALVMFSDGQTRHVGYWHRRQVTHLAKQGVGIGAIHYAVEMLPDESNQALISWIGGAFEVNYSVNPHWTAEFKELPNHPVANGVAPFSIEDEWYFNMRFAPDMEGVTPILTAVPPDSTMDRPDGHHSGNPEVRKMVAEKQPQHVCWVYDREDGGRGFGFTGTHFHENWRNDNFRKVLMNAICWISKAEVPENGVETPTPTEEEMNANLDPKPEKKPK